MSATQQVTGLASGFDTASIVESLMKIEKVPYDKLDVKKQTQQLKLQAYQAVNSMLLKFRTSVGTLSSQKTWRAKAAASTNENALKGTANEYAVNGSYSFKVAQLATAAQFMSKGFASSKTAFVKQLSSDKPYKLGEITLNSAKSRVDTSAKVDSLNGGKGMYRGSVRVTDAAGHTSVIDLSTCDTMDDVVKTLNASTGAQINASIKDGKLLIADESTGSGTLKIQNVGTGTTATDLGIAGSAKAGDNFIHGRNVYTLGNEMSLKSLQDGLGVEEGKMFLMVSSGSSYYEVEVNVDDCATVGDVMKRVNNEIEYRVQNKKDSANGASWEMLDGLRLTLSDDKTAFALAGTKAGSVYQFFDDYNANRTVLQTPAEQLGLTGMQLRATDDNDVLTFNRCIGEVDSPMLKSLSGVNGGGIGSLGEGSKVSIPFSGDTKISALNQGKGVDFSMPLQIRVYEGGKDVSLSESDARTFYDIIDTAKLNSIVNDKNSTISELTQFLNEQIRAYAADPDNDAAALTGMQFLIDEENARMVVVGAQAGYTYEIRGTMANDLGIYRYDSGNVKGALANTDTSKKSALESFYKAKDLIGGNDVIEARDREKVTKAENKDEEDTVETIKATTLKELGGLHGIVGDPGDPDATPPVPAGDPDPAAVEDALKNLIEKTGGMQLTISTKGAWIRDDLYCNDRSPDITVNLNGLKARLATRYAEEGGYSNLTATELVDAINEEIQAQVDADIEKKFKPTPPDDPTDQQAMDEYNAALDSWNNSKHLTISAPQLRLNPVQKGYQWSNMDYTKDFSASGDLAAALGVDKSIAAADIGKQPDSIMSDFNFNPVATAYVEDIPLDGSVQLGYLNNGASLTFGGDETDELTIDLGDNKSVTLTMGELRQAINGKLSLTLEGTGDAYADAAKSLNTTLDNYARILNALVKDKMNEAGIDTSTVGLEFAMGKSGLVVQNVTGADRLVISGTAADVKKTGLGTLDQKSADPSKTYKLGNLKAGEVKTQTVHGIGDITLTLGNGHAVTLRTYDILDDSDPDNVVVGNELNEYSTLAQLIDRLNGELDKLHTADPDAGYNDVRFVVNDAGTGIAVTNSSNKELNFVYDNDANTLAKDLGLVDGETGKGIRVEAFSHHNSTSLGRKFIGRATSLETIMGGPNIPNGSIKLTNGYGISTIIDLTDAKTVGDVIDAINLNETFGIFAQLNERGDGIDLIEAYAWYDRPEGEPVTNISISDVDGGSLAKKLGIAGTGTRGEDGTGASVYRGSQRNVIEVMSSDTLESLMYRISEKGDYKTAIINDGSGSNPYRLTITSATTGEASDFVIESDLDMFGFSQSSRGKDSKVLYGDANSSSSPILLSSSTNSNSNAILGLTLELKSVTNDWTTISVDTDKESVVEEIKNMVQTYNDLNDLVSYLDAYDEESGEPGVLFGDSAVRTLMEDINDLFYAVFNPDNLSYYDMEKQAASKGQQTFTWMDIGVSLSAKNSASDGSGNWYSSMDLDLDTLNEMVANNWDLLYNVLAGQRNASNTNLEESVKPSATFNGKAAEGFSADNAVNGDSNTGSWGANNGFMANGTIEQGENEYTIYFQKPTTMSRMSIYHYDADTALKNFTVEYLDANTGKWETLRDIKNNGVESNHLGMAIPTSVQAIRITASSTNAEDGKFRLLDVQVFEDTGLAGQLNHLTTALGDTSSGWLFERNDEIKTSISDIDEQMERLSERLDKKEESLWKRFTAMETALGTMQNQSNYFSTMMDSLSTKKK